MTSTTSANLFTCTFCFRLSSGPPQILGRSARLACKACCTTLLDLSIYWVCGELIFRGEDCVSFGWCFWHKACYGCLLCGNRLVHRGVKIPALFAGEPKQKNGRGKELTEAPICAPCMVDSEVDGVNEEVLVKRGLRRVERYDAGVTRKRWEEREGEAGRDGSKGKARAANLETGKLSRGFGIDGTGEGASQDSIIWVNLFDPINGPSFKPSPLKPVPWFQPRALSTSAWDQELRLSSKANSETRSSLHSDSTRSGTPTIRFTRSPSLDGRDAILPASREIPPTTTASETPFWSVDSSAVSFKRQPTVVREEPLQRPSSRLKPRTRGSETLCSAYLTPPEFPDYPSTSELTAEAVTSSASTATAKIITRLTQLQREYDAHSSEYVEEYHPITSIDQKRYESSPPPLELARRNTVLDSIVGGHKVIGEKQDWVKSSKHARKWKITKRRSRAEEVLNWTMTMLR
ncbi:hypothetical protein V2G26_013534 [Clonostachys chloroleuca]